MKIWTDVPEERDCLRCQHFEDRFDGIRHDTICRLFNTPVTCGAPCDLCTLRREQSVRAKEENIRNFSVKCTSHIHDGCHAYN